MHAVLRPMLDNGMSWDQQKPVDLTYERNREAKDKELWPARLEQYKTAREEWEASQAEKETTPETTPEEPAPPTPEPAATPSEGETVGT
jgi:hypothetical protein